MAFTNSALATYTHISPNRTSPRDQPTITKIIVHHMAGVLSLEEFDNIVSNPSREMSSNYAIDKDGRVGLFCEESDRCWCSSSPWADHRGIAIEVSNDAVNDSWPISDKVFKVLIQLCADICHRNNIPKLEFTGDQNGSLCFHYMFASTACPGPYIKDRANYLCTEVNKLLQSNSTNWQIPSGVNPSSISSYDYATSQGTISIEPDYSQIDCRMAVIDRKSGSVDYKKLKDIGCIGVLLEVGYLYDSSHVETTYLNPQLKNHIKRCTDADMKYGFQAIVRSRSVAEAKAELKWLLIYVQKYRPQLGVWLKLELPGSKGTNDLILKEYKNILENAGYKSRIGICADRSQLSKISWANKWKDDYALWLIDNVKDIDEINQLLTPEFFKY